MRYQKRLAMPKTWPLPKKGKNTYVLSPIGKKKTEAISLIIILRDLLKISKTRKEAEKILRNKDILIDDKVIKDCKFPVGLLDMISIPKLNKYYKLTLKNNKLNLDEISEKDSHEKICKVIGKKQISEKEMQINLFGGKNLIYNGKVSVNDSILLDLKQNKIIKIYPLKEGAKALILFGKHSNERGEIKKIIRDEKVQEAVLLTKHGEIKIPIKNIFVFD